MSIIKKYHKQAGGNDGYNPWLKPENLDESGTVFVITDVREAVGMKWSDILVDVKAGREMFTLGMKGDAVVLDQIVTVLGDNEKKWIGKKIRFYLAKGKYVNATEPNARPTAKGKPKARGKSKTSPSKRGAKKR